MNSTTTNQLIAAIPKHPGEELRVELCPFKGSHFLGLRIWAREGGRLRPTEKGLTVPLRMAGPLLEAIRATVAEAKAKPEQPQLFGQRDAG
jgi:hypothetical protein